MPDIDVTISEFTELALKYNFDADAFNSKKTGLRGYINFMLNG